MYQEKRFGNNFRWISVNDPSDEDIHNLQQEFQLSRKFESYVRDPRERSRFDYNVQTNTGMLIWQVVVKTSDTNIYQVLPISFIVTHDTLISTIPATAKHVNQELAKLVTKVIENDSTLTILLRLLWRLNDEYMDQIDDINVTREGLASFNKNPSNRQIKQLASLSNQLVHLTTATDNNVMAIKQLKLTGDDASDELTLTNKERDLVADVEIETAQSQQITQDTSDLVERLSNTYNNLLNNSLNDNMRFLTVWSLILAVPPIISGFYGMNVYLPLAQGPWAWVGTLGMTLLLIIIVIYLVKRRK